MQPDNLSINIVFILTMGFAYAGILGYLAVRFGLASFIGYLLAGFLIGPFSPGFVADLKTSEQLAEIGVILMMFGVGLDFKWEDLTKVKKIATAGALGQTATAAAITACIVYLLGWPLQMGIILGLGVGVASTVVLIKVLSDRKMMNTTEAHISIGWLLVEDLIIIAVLILGPALFFSKDIGNFSLDDFMWPLFTLAVKFALLAAIMLTLGRKFVSYALSKVDQTQSHELFTVAVLSLTFVIATGSSVLFGTSIALGAFIAGMAIGQTEVRHKAVLHSMHLKDAFVVVFFLSVGMLFNPLVIVEHFSLFITVLAVIMIVKPLTAFLIALLSKKSYYTSLTVAFALAQVGELSFILTEEAMNYKVLPDEGFDALVAGALVSISLNPFLFRLLSPPSPEPKKEQA